MFNLLNSWVVDGPNKECKPLIRLQIIPRDKNSLNDEKFKYVVNENNVKTESLLTNAITYFAKSKFDLKNIDFSIERKNDAIYLLFSNMEKNIVLDIYGDSIKALTRLGENPKSNLTHILNELSAPVHSGQKPTVFGVTGTNGKTSVVNLLYGLIKKLGGETSRVGKVDSIDVKVDSLDIFEGISMNQFESSRLLLQQNIDYAVIEAARKGLWMQGLPTNNLSTGIITNIANDHIGTYGIESLEDLFTVKSIVAKEAKNIAVLNYEDGLLRKLNSELENTVVYFGKDENSGIKKMDRFVSIDEKNVIYISDRGNKTKLFGVDDVSYFENGFAKHNIENALSAISAVYFDPNIDFDVAKVNDYFSRVTNNNLVCGRLNSFALKNNVLIYLDYAHNPDGITVLGNTLRKKHGSVSCLTSIDGNRDSVFCDEVAKKLNDYFNPIYVKETDLECVSNAKSTPEHLINSIRKLDSNKEIIYIPNEGEVAYSKYLNMLSLNSVGVILGAGLDSVSEVKDIILKFQNQI